MPVADNVVSPPSVFVSIPHPPIVPKCALHQRLSASYSASGNSREAQATARCSDSSADTQSTTEEPDSARPQTLAECQEFISRLEADSVKQAYEVFFMSV